MYCILKETRIKPRSRPSEKKSTYFTHPDFSVAKIGKKERKLREQIRYVVKGEYSVKKLVWLVSRLLT